MTTLFLKERKFHHVLYDFEGRAERAYVEADNTEEVRRRLKTMLHGTIAGVTVVNGPSGDPSGCICCLIGGHCIDRCDQRQAPRITAANPSGWACPKCGAVYAPHVPSCWFCFPKVVT